MAHYEYEFEVLALSAGGYSLFGGVGIRTEGHQEVIRSRAADRINELARKAKSPAGLTPEEEAERALLRQEYIAACKSNLMAHLDNTLIQHPDGTRTRLRKK